MSTAREQTQRLEAQVSRNVVGQSHTIESLIMRGFGFWWKTRFVLTELRLNSKELSQLQFATGLI